jgi:hypothetical protein
MRSLVRSAAVLAAFMATSLAFAHILPIITRDDDYNRSGLAILEDPMASTWGGVVMQVA